MAIATMVTTRPSAARDDSTRDPQAWMPTGSDVQLTAHTDAPCANFYPVGIAHSIVSGVTVSGQL
jgi:hypothetical protein